MRHKKAQSLFNRFTSWRKATLKSLARSLLLHQSIKTTLDKAKAARPLAEQLISLAKKDTLAARRKAYAILGEHKLVSLLFKEIGPRFVKRTGGYTRIINLARRQGDNAQVVIFELTEIKKKETPKRAKKKENKPEEEGKIDAPQGEKEASVDAKEEHKSQTAVVKEKPPITQKPSKKFLGGLRNIFKKERDSL
jgi:large subunit ribosomal protein L17